MYSNKLKHVMWIELTSPWEDNFDTSYLRKKGRYNKLEKLVKMAGWGVTPLYAEVGTLGKVNKTWGEMSKGLGMTKAESKRLKLKCSKIALRCSYFLYLSRKEKVWQAHKLLQHGGSERTVLPTQQRPNRPLKHRT
jgi:hypothetical protein